MLRLLPRYYRMHKSLPQPVPATRNVGRCRYCRRRASLGYFTRLDSCCHAARRRKDLHTPTAPAATPCPRHYRPLHYHEVEELIMRLSARACRRRTVSLLPAYHYIAEITPRDADTGRDGSAIIVNLIQ